MLRTNFNMFPGKRTQRWKENLLTSVDGWKELSLGKLLCEWPLEITLFLLLGALD